MRLESGDLVTQDRIIVFVDGEDIGGEFNFDKVNDPVLPADDQIDLDPDVPVFAAFRRPRICLSEDTGYPQGGFDLRQMRIAYGFEG